MDLSIKKQISTGGYIERFWDNLIKAGKDKLTRHYMQARLELLESYWSRFLAEHDVLLSFDKVEDSEYVKKDVYGITEENYLAVKARISSSLATQATPDKSEASTVIKQIQLPKIDLPTFSGDQLAWEGFRDLFKSLVHNVEGLAPIQKLQYLKTSLTGEAAAAVGNLPFTSDGYQQAWEELTTRYDNPRVLLATHMRVLLGCSPMTKPSSQEICRLISAVNQAIRSFRGLERPVDFWDDWFVHILVEKLDSPTRLLWESSLKSSREFPTYSRLKEFLISRAHALDAANPRALQPASANQQNNKPKRSGVSSHASSTDTDQRSQCPLCGERHLMRTCARFKAYTAEQRREQVRKKKACFNCLSLGHSVGSCPSVHRCRHCQEKHHSLLHLSEHGATSLPPAARDATTASTSSDKSTAEEEPARVAVHSCYTNGTVLIATAVVRLISDTGRYLTVRALLDSASEASFVTERVAQQLRLPRRRVNVTVSGLQGVTTGKAEHAVSVMIGTERAPTLRIALPRALVLPKLTAFTPDKRIPRRSWPHLDGLPLADPNFDKPAAVDAVLGADVYGLLLEGGVRRGAEGEPTAHSTIFGWVLMGSLTRLPDAHSDGIVAYHVVTQPDLHDELRRFWELEEVPTDKILSPEEAHCEQQFADTHTRDAEGRYVVRLPKREGSSAKLGASRQGALQTLLSIERRLERDPSLKQKYADFMAEYKSLGHMEKVPEVGEEAEKYYLPHHAVVKANDPSGKIRVVFNASFRTSTGVSLNDVLLPGPKLQADLWLVLTRWRLHQYAFTTDIVKMFRQIRVHPDDLHLQRVLWRPNPESNIQDFQLTTVTYGTASAPYLAIRTLLQLARDEGTRFPVGAAVLRDSTYVDDVLAGASTLDQALEVRRQLTALLESGGFRLSKWAGTHAELCPDGDQSERLLTDADGVGTLGVLWIPAEDALRLRAVPTLLSIREPTKRAVLSDVAKLFDPAGWAAPALIGAKIMLQDLWMAGLDWDQALHPVLRERWTHFASSLPDLNRLSLPRWTGVSSGREMELHGFSDASERAYAAAIYLRGIGPDGLPATNLLVAKTKVAPVKPVSIPRLELCGAALTARLLHRTAEGLSIPVHRLHAWTDARVVLAWIRAHPSRWKPFVANRVAAIQELIPADRWHHVPTAENPADAATRGMTPNELIDFQLWWSGPRWLSDPSVDRWPTEEDVHSTCEERQALATAAGRADGENSLIYRFSSLSRLIRVTAYIMRWRHLRTRPPTTHLSAAELEDARLRWLRLTQREYYADELGMLSREAPLPRRSPLLALRPFRGPKGLIRVGGRLEQSPLAYDEKHPVVLPKESHLAHLLVRDAHLRTLHGGPQLTRSVLARRYWIIHANSLIRALIHRCVKCTRFRGETAQQQMGQLPTDRVQASRPFRCAGVDYAGPISLRASKGRGHKSFKGYICLFVCMATRAVHLEVASDLTTSSFLAAFKRFTARRGHCAKLMSDNGTNFRGADRELRAMFDAAAAFYQECKAQLASDGTEWAFIPPSAPHFGGLWEAGVKSTKHHLRRTLGDHLLTYEELATLLCQIEACLNSRPIHPMSADPADFAALTPGHFLIGEAPINLPETSTLNDTPGSLNLRWKLVNNIRDHFWHRWSAEYLQHLQQLGKWRLRKANLQPGTLVLIKDELQPPAKWALGRVRDARSGPDGLVRVVEVDTASTRLLRPISKVCPLPVTSDLGAATLP